MGNPLGDAIQGSTFATSEGRGRRRTELGGVGGHKWRTKWRTANATIPGIAEFELGRLLRLEEAIRAASEAVEPDGASAFALTESYVRLRAQGMELVKGSDLETEFESMFPAIDVAEAPSRHPRVAAQSVITGEPVPRQARTLLGQLAGWIGGIVRRMTLERQMELDAEARAKLEARKPPGFAPES